MKYLLIALLVVGCGKVQGQKGDPGAQGPKGDAGSVGSTGPQGASGADGTAVTVVQLCPGTSTHDVFVEVAICLNNELWAVYSANGGFLTYLAPGAYTSNGIGSACSFTVGANCTISP